MVAMSTIATISDYDVEGDWTFLTTCNYRCSYCFVPPEELGAKIEIFATPEQWRAAFDATGKRWLIHLTGGEPTVYPDFMALCEALTQRHVISINSNLSRPVVRQMAGRIDPSRVSFINAGLHVAERTRRAGSDDFLDNARFLQEAGFRVIVTAVATPEVVADFSSLASMCAAYGLQLAPKVVRGEYKGKSYPWEYTPEEKAQLHGAIARARDRYAQMFEGWPPPTIDVLSDDEFLDGLPDYRGRSCSAGFRFVNLQPNGDVYRCNPGRVPMGNLLKGTLRLGGKPAPCDTQYCPYFCKKYTADALNYKPQLHALQRGIACTWSV